MGCLPEISEWSLPSQFLLLQDHLEALRWHMDKLESHFKENAAQVLAERQHYQEMMERIVESQAILKQLATHSETELKDLKIETG